MPFYEFMNSETGQIEEKMVKIADLEEFLKNNPHLTKTLTSAPALGDPARLGVRRVDNGFREVMQKIADTTPGGKGLRDQIR